MLESPRKASVQLGLSDWNQGGVSHFLGLRGPACVAFGVAPSIGMLPIGSGKGCHIFILGDCLGIGVRGVAAGGCSSTGVAFHGRMCGGNGRASPNRIWYEVAMAPLSGGGL